MAEQFPATNALGEPICVCELQRFNFEIAPDEELLTVARCKEFSKDSFALTKNTRFEANGLIFRIQESATVPGYTVAADGTVTAGTVAAKVFADTPGEEGNIAPAQFTVPGLKD